MSDKKLKPLPTFEADEEAGRFIDEADLTEFDLSSGKLTSFEFEKKTKQINLRMPESLIKAVKAKAAARNMPYQRFIREALEKALQ